MKSTAMADKERKYIIDMDIADDIDDAIALYAAMQRGFDIAGVTTVFRNTCDRAKIAKRLMTLFGKGYENVPVYAGHGRPMCAAQETYDAPPHYNEDAENYVPESTDPEDAVDFIIRACRTYGKQLTVIAIGPFTNIARVIEKDPEALNMCGSVCIMGGAFFKQYADWNIMCDVEAADIMFRGLDNLVCCGADVTHLCRADETLYNSLMNYEGSKAAHRYLREMCDLWKKDRPDALLLLHDPLVIYNIAEPQLCGMQTAEVAVICEGFARGMSLNVDAYGKRRLNISAYEGQKLKKCLVAKTVDVETLLKMMNADFAE